MTAQLPSSKEQLLADIAHAEEKADTLCGPCADDHARLAWYLRALLAAHEQEPVAWLLSGGGAKNDVRFDSGNAYADPLREVTPLYTHPAPVPVVPDEHYQHLSELYHSQEKRLFKLAQRIKGPSFDKYAYSPSQAIDVLETAIFGDKVEDGSDALQSAPFINRPHPGSTGVTDFLPPQPIPTAKPIPAHVAVPDCFHNAVSALESLYRNGQKQNWNERYTTDMAYASGVLNACRAAMLNGGKS